MRGLFVVVILNCRGTFDLIWLLFPDDDSLHYRSSSPTWTRIVVSPILKMAAAPA